MENGPRGGGESDSFFPQTAEFRTPGGETPSFIPLNPPLPPLSPSSALATLTGNTITNNRANSDQTIGIIIGGSSPPKMDISGFVCHDNTPKAVCQDPR
jgi:hypothetical protein